MPDTTRREFVALIGGGGLLLTVKVRRARGQWRVLMDRDCSAVADCRNR
jgi:hypothetical protein